MKTLLSILLGLMLLTSLVGISYAIPIMQPTQGSGDVNACVNLKPHDPNWYSLGCAGAAHQNGNENPPQRCFAGKTAPDGFCCHLSISPQGLEVSDIHTDLTCQQ